MALKPVERCLSALSIASAKSPESLQPPTACAMCNGRHVTQAFLRINARAVSNIRGSVELCDDVTQFGLHIVRRSPKGFEVVNERLHEGC